MRACFCVGVSNVPNIWHLAHLAHLMRVLLYTNISNVHNRVCIINTIFLSNVNLLNTS